MTKEHHGSLGYKDLAHEHELQKIRSSTLRNLIILHELWTGEPDTTILGAPVSPDYKWIMEHLHCSMRTAYDYARALSWLMGIIGR